MVNAIGECLHKAVVVFTESFRWAYHLKAWFLGCVLWIGEVYGYGFHVVDIELMDLKRRI